jgi:hypothetical protein
MAYTNQLSFKFVRPISRQGVNNVRHHLMEVDWSFINSNSNVEDDYNLFLEKLCNITDVYLPIQSITNKVKDNNKWITNGIRTSCKNKSKICRLIKQGKYPLKDYTIYKNKLNSNIRSAKSSFYYNLCAKNV